MRPRVLATLVLALLTASPIVSAEETRVGPDRAGWWRIGPLALVTGAGLDDGELLVDGFGPEESSWQAVSALSFPFDRAAGAVVPAMTLQVPVVSASIPGTELHLCTVTSEFEAVANGAGEDVPQHDCSSTITGTVGEDGLLTASGIESSIAGSHIRLLLVPAQPGRIVLDGAAASVRAAAPSDAAPAPPPSAPQDPRNRVPGPEGDVSAPTPAFEPNPPASSGFPASPGFEDEIAAPPTEPQAAPPSLPARPATRTVFSPPAGDSAARRVTALVVALVLGLFTVLNRGGTARLRAASVPWLRGESSTPSL